MLDVFRDSGFAVESTMERGVCRVTIALAVTAAVAGKAAFRSHTAATASMKAFFEPRSVVVIGANRERGKIGSEILHNLIASGFTGALAAIHPNAAKIDGVSAYPSIGDVPGPIDLAVVVVPAAAVLHSVDACIAKGVRAICVISAGFSECGEEGRARERELVERIRLAGCRLIGPNCMGLLNTDPAVGLNATFAPVAPPAGTVAMSTQSGALGLAILDYAKRLHIGISSFVSVGNKPDVSGNDLISVLGGGSAHVGHPALPRELRQSEEVQRHCPPRWTNEADRRGQGGPIVSRGSRRQLPYRRARHRATRSSTRSSVTPASFARSGSRRCSTWQRSWRISRFHEGGASRSSPTLAVPASWRPMPARHMV